MNISEKIYNIDLLNTSLRFLLKATVFSSAFYFFSFIAADPDLWGHIKFGKDLWTCKTFHRFDIYSYTAYGREWINHEWLSEIIMYLAYKTTGSPGLIFGKLITGLIIVYILSRISFNRTFHPFIYCPVFVLAVFVMSPGFMIRPQIFTFLFTSIFMFILHLYFDRKTNYLFFLPLIMILWVNCHGGFLIGVGMLPIALICSLISNNLKKNGTGYELFPLSMWLLLTGAASLVNPYGHQLFIFLYKSLSTSRNIWEWQPVSLFDLSYFRFKFLALLFFLTLFFPVNKRRYWELGIIIFSLFFAFKHQRHTPIFAIVVAPHLVDYLTSILLKTRLHKKITSFMAFLVLIIFVFILVGYQLYSTGCKYVTTHFNIIVDPQKYPVYAVHFLKQNNIKGNILLPFEWGEYVIWKLYPDCNVSIDGRFRTVYPQEVIDNHFEVSVDEHRWNKLIGKYPTEIILAKRNAFFERLISARTKWIYVYSDRISMIFVKRGNAQMDVLKKLKRKDLKYPRKQLSVYFP